MYYTYWKLNLWGFADQAQIKLELGKQSESFLKSIFKIVFHFLIKKTG